MTAADFIARWEGFSSVAYWDVNHWRLGYGSDTEGPEQVNVVQGMTTTKERALQNLALRIPKFEQTAVRAVGADAWEKLADNQRTALLSLVYNYGRLPDSVARAILTGNPDNVAGAIRTLQAANGGVNRKRRLGEAQFYLTGSEAAKPIPPISKGAIVIGTAAGSGAITSGAAGAQPLVTIIMAMISAGSYLFAYFTSKPKTDVPVPGPHTQLSAVVSPLDDFKAALDELRACQLKVEAKRKIIVDEVEKMSSVLASIDVKIIEHQPSIEGK
jgi:GH24 family phage-related lysozyme (muramidase)